MTTVSIERVTLRTQTDAQSMPPRAGMFCKNQAVVKMKGVRVMENTQGILAQGCGMLEGERSYVGHNAKEGIFLDVGSGYHLTNLLVVENGGVGAWFETAQGTFAFNTVAGNGKSDAASQKGGGLYCKGSTPVLVQNTLLVGNQMEARDMTQVQGDMCKLLAAVVSVADALPTLHSSSQLVIKNDVSFTQQGFLWRLNTLDPMWDVFFVRDRAVPLPEVEVDYFGENRPRAVTQRTPGGTGYDIGHQQLP